MMAGQHGAAQIIEARVTFLTAPAPAVPLDLVMTVADHLPAYATRAPHAIGLPMLRNEQVAFCIIDERSAIDQVRTSHTDTNK